MTVFADTDWPLPTVDPTPGRRGVPAVWRLEVTKLARLSRVHLVLAACAVAPFLAAVAFAVQGAVPADTLFGQWVHQSGFATSLVVLGFAGQWALPFVVAVVAGDIFSAEDHFGTWKTVLTRSRTRADIFAGKLLAALTYTVLVLGLLAAAALAAAADNARAVTGLGGQLVLPGRAAELVAVSWAVQLPPMLAFVGIAILVSVLSRSSVVGIGAPVLIGLAGQLLSLVDLPTALRAALPGTGFEAWHGVWADPPFYGPVRHAAVAGVTWLAVCVLLAWSVFRRRNVRIAA